MAGQSFRNHVAGAGAGAKMTDYKLTDWSFTGAPVSSTTYSDGASFTIDIDFTQNSRAQYIKRIGAGMIVVAADIGPDYSGDPVDGMQPGFGVSSSSSSVVGTASGSSVSVTLQAPQVPPAGYNVSAWFDGYTSPNYPVAGQDPDPISFKGSVFGGNPSGTSLVAFNIAYAPDNGPFNPTLYHTFTLTMYKRASDTNPNHYDWEWYTEADYLTYGYDGVHYVSNNSQYNTVSSAGQSQTVYMRARENASKPWVNYGQYTFTDPRPAP